MPYADPERRKQARREWSSSHLRKAARYQQSRSKYDATFDLCERHPGVDYKVGTFSNQNVASALAWRIENNFYRGGKWEAWTRGPSLFVRFDGAAS